MAKPFKKGLKAVGGELSEVVGYEEFVVGVSLLNVTQFRPNIDSLCQEGYGSMEGLGPPAVANLLSNPALASIAVVD